jgi:hypothetical protein
LWGKEKVTGHSGDRPSLGVLVLWGRVGERDAVDSDALPVDRDVVSRSARDVLEQNG